MVATEMEMIDVWRTLHPLEKDYTHYSLALDVHSRFDYLFMNIEDEHRINEFRIGGADMSDHNRLYLKINLNNRKRQTVQRLNLGILNNRQRKETIKTEKKRYSEENEGTTDPTILWDAMKAVIRGRLISETAYAKKDRLEIYRIYNEKLRELEMKHQKTNDPKIHQQIRETRTKINYLLLEEIEIFLFKAGL